MARKRRKPVAGPISLAPDIKYRCPLTGQSLHTASVKGPKAKALGAVHSVAEQLLLTEDETLAYPVIDGIAHIAIEYAIGQSIPASPVAQARHDEINEEIDIYNKMASRDQTSVSQSAIRLFGQNFCDQMASSQQPGTFPHPLATWVDSVGSADTQFAAYEFLAPLEDTRFLQLGGSGSHAVKALIAGARCSGLLSPSIEEIKLGRALAEHFGVADRFFGIVGIGEMFPLCNDSLDRIYGGGCLHHTEITHSIPEIGRCLTLGGRASFVDPRENPVYSSWSHFLGRVRFCGDEEDTHDHPLDADELLRLAAGRFRHAEILPSGGLARYAVVLAARTVGIAPSVTQAARLFSAERTLIDALKLDNMYGNMAIMLER